VLSVDRTAQLSIKKIVIKMIKLYANLPWSYDKSVISKFQSNPTQRKVEFLIEGLAGILASLTLEREAQTPEARLSMTLRFNKKLLIDEKDDVYLDKDCIDLWVEQCTPYLGSEGLNAKIENFSDRVRLFIPNLNLVADQHEIIRKILESVVNHQEIVDSVCGVVKSLVSNKRKQSRLPETLRSDHEQADDEQEVKRFAEKSPEYNEPLTYSHSIDLSGNMETSSSQVFAPPIAIRSHKKSKGSPLEIKKEKNTETEQDMEKEKEKDKDKSKIARPKLSLAQRLVDIEKERAERQAELEKKRQQELEERESEAEWAITRQWFENLPEEPCSLFDVSTQPIPSPTPPPVTFAYKPNEIQERLKEFWILTDSNETIFTMKLDFTQMTGLRKLIAKFQEARLGRTISAQDYSISNSSGGTEPDVERPERPRRQPSIPFTYIYPEEGSPFANSEQGLLEGVDAFTLSLKCIKEMEKNAHQDKTDKIFSKIAGCLGLSDQTLAAKLVEWEKKEGNLVALKLKEKKEREEENRKIATAKEKSKEKESRSRSRTHHRK